MPGAAENTPLKRLGQAHEVAEVARVPRVGTARRSSRAPSSRSTAAAPCRSRERGPVRRRARQPRRGHAAAHRAAAPTSTTSRCRGCCTRTSCAARTPAPRSAGSTPSAALAAPGVHAVFTAADLNPGVKEQWHTTIGPLSPETPRPPLAEDEVRFVGDPVALVIAATRALAEDAADLVDIDFEPLPAVVDYTDGRARDGARPRAARLQRHRRARRPARLRARRRVRGGRARDDARRSTSRRVPPRRWRDAASSSTTYARRATSRSTPRRSRPTRSGSSAPACSGCPSTASGS